MWSESPWQRGTTHVQDCVQCTSLFDISPSFLGQFWRFWALWICTFQDKVNGYKITALTDTGKNFFSNRFLSSYPWSLDFAVRDRERTGQKLIIEPQILAFYCYTNDFWGPNSTTTTFYTGRSHDTGQERRNENLFFSTKYFKSCIWLGSVRVRSNILLSRCRQMLNKYYYITGIRGRSGLLMLLMPAKRHFWSTKSAKLRCFSFIFRELFFIGTLFYNNNRGLKVNLGSKHSSSTPKMHGFLILRVQNLPGGASPYTAFSALCQNKAIWLAVGFVTSLRANQIFYYTNGYASPGQGWARGHTTLGGCLPPAMWSD